MGLISQPFKAYKALVLQPRPVGQVLEYQPWASEKRNSGQSREILGLQLLCVQLWFRLPWSNGIWLVFGLCEYSPAPIPSSFRTHCAGCRPEGAPVGGSASLHNSGTGWWRALQIDGALLRWQVEPGIGLRGWVSGPGPTRPQCTSGKPSPQVSHLPVHPAYLWAAPAAVAHWTRNRCPHYAWLHSRG